MVTYMKRNLTARYFRRIDRVSAYTLFANIPAYIYLLIIPMIQNFLFDPEGIWQQLASNAVGLLMAAGAAAISAVDYSRRRFRLTKRGAVVSQGIFLRSVYRVSYEKLRSVTFVKAPLTDLFSAEKIVLGISPRDGKRGTLYISHEKSEQLKDEMRTALGSENDVYRAKNRKVFLLCALLSNPITGFLAAVPFVRGIGRAAGAQARDELLRTLDFSRYLIYLGIPPVAAFIAYLLFACYLFSAAVMFLRNGDLTCTFYNGGVVIRKGIVHVRETVIPLHRITALKVTQSVLMKPMGLYNCYVKIEGKGKKSLFLCTAAASKEDIGKINDMIKIQQNINVL